MVSKFSRKEIDVFSQETQSELRLYFWPSASFEQQKVHLIFYYNSLNQMFRAPK